MTYRSFIQRVLPANAGQAAAPTAVLSQVPNNAGGWFHPIDHWARLERFLILGTEGGTYYVGETRLTRENAASVIKCLTEDGRRTIDAIERISVGGRGPKAEPALFALALAAATPVPETRAIALAALPRVARTGTHVLVFADYVDVLRGWGRGLRRGVARWFTAMPADRLALQAVKYRQREGWALRDLLRLAHPLTDEMERRAIFDWIAHPDRPDAIATARRTSHLIDGLYACREATEAADVAAAIERNSLPRETVPTEWLDRAEVWDALLVDMPMTAMIRNLGKMSAVGLLAPGSDASRYVAERLTDGEQLRGARIHPIQVLLALRTYASGRGLRGGLAWQPVPAIADALDAAYDGSFANVVPTGKRILVAVDVSGSMTGGWGNGRSPLTALEAAAAVAQVFLRTEERAEVIAVDTSVHLPGFSRGQRLDDFVATCRRYGGGGTDMSLPYQYAIDSRRAFDAVVTLTDGETWAGWRSPLHALEQYRRDVNPAVKSAVLAAVANHGSIVPDDDPTCLGVAGFDAAAPQLVGDFIRS